MKASDLCHLKTNHGKYLDIKKFPDGMKLQVVEVQNEETTAPTVIVFTEALKMAFRFKHGEECYYLKVNGEKLELEETTSPDKPNSSLDHYWFKKQDLGAGDHYFLYTGVSPVLYISTVESHVILYKSNSVLKAGEEVSNCVLEAREKEQCILLLTHSPASPSTI